MDPVRICRVCPRAAVVTGVLVVLVTLLAARPAAAQEFSVHGGAMENAKNGDASYAWMLQYRQRLAKDLSLTVAWLNEGHPTDHHRDGLVIQAWAGKYFRRRLAGGLGLGMYRFYDSVKQPVTGEAANLHGYAAILSVTGSYDITPRWVARATLDRTWSEDDRSIDTSELLLGIAYRFVELKPGEGGEDSGAVHGRTTGKEAMAFVGRTIVNTFDSEKSVAKGVEFRYGTGKHTDLTISLINEGDPQVTRRNGLGAQIWLVNAVMSKKLTFGVGFGPYIYLDQRKEAEDGQSAGGDIAGLVTVGASWRFAESWYTRLNWNRVVTDYDRDSDVIVVGVGYRWHND